MKKFIQIFLATDEENYASFYHLLNKTELARYKITWNSDVISTFNEIQSKQYDICIIDRKYLISKKHKQDFNLISGLSTPIILLIERYSQSTYSDIVKIGAADFLIKNQLSTPLIEHVIYHVLGSKNMMEALSEAELRYASIKKQINILLENTYDWEYWIGLDGKFLYVSPACERITGYLPDEFINNPDLLKTIIHPDDRPTIYPRLLEYLSIPPKIKDVFDFRIITRDGEVRWIMHNSEPVYDTNGKVMALRANNRDITERKRSELSLQKHEESFKQIIETLNDVFWIITSDDNIYISSTYENVWGRSQHSFYDNPQSILDTIYSDDRERILRAFSSDDYRLGGRFDEEYRIVRPDGTIRWLRTRIFFIRSDSEPPRTFGIAEDITERKLTKATLQRNEEQYRTLVKNFPNGAVFLFDEKLRISLADGAGLEDFGMTTKFLVGKTLRECLSSETCDLLEPQLIAAFNGQFSNSEFSIGDHIYEIKMLPMKYENSEVSACLAIAQDVTNRHTMEENLKKANASLSVYIKELEQHNLETDLFNRMGELLQSCRDVNEVHTIVKHYVPKLFPNQPGVLYLLNQSDNLFEMVTYWGSAFTGEPKFQSSDCWGLRQGQIYSPGNINAGPLCKHLGKNIQNSSSFPYLCIPLIAHGEILGLLHTQIDVKVLSLQHWMSLAMTLEKWIAPAIANLQLGEILRDQSIRDALTGLFNRRYMVETLNRELRRAVRHNHPIGIVMIDIDHFKNINDTFGHDAGDIFLQELGKYLQNNVRGEDFANRYGGEEFILVMPEVTLEDTINRAEQFRQGIENLHITFHDKTITPITVSIGVSIFPNHGSTLRELINVADQALYQAKNEGRNRVVLAKG